MKARTAVRKVNRAPKGRVRAAPQAVVSVVLPTYNRVFLLQRAVKSVLAQTFKNFHLYIVDDQSTDGTSVFARKIKDKRVTYIRQPKNLGVAANWLSGMQQVKSKYFCLLMDDDFFAPDFLRSRIRAFEKAPQSAVAFGTYKPVDEAGKKLRPARELSQPDGHVFDPLSLLQATNGGGIHIGGMVFRTDYLSKIWTRSADYGIVIDAALMLMLVFQQERGGVYVKKVNFNMTHQPNQVFEKRREEVYREMYRLLIDISQKRNLSYDGVNFLKDSISTLLQDWAMYLADSNRLAAFAKWVRALWVKPYVNGLGRRRLYILARILGFRA